MAGMWSRMLKAPLAKRDEICSYRDLAKAELDSETRIALGGLYEINRLGASATINPEDAAVLIRHILSLQKTVDTMKGTIKTVDIKVGEEGWVAWSGGPCPVDHLAPVGLLLRNNEVVTPAMPAASADWVHRNNSHDIVAYRVVAP